MSVSSRVCLYPADFRLFAAVLARGLPLHQKSAGVYVKGRTRLDAMASLSALTFSAGSLF